MKRFEFSLSKSLTEVIKILSENGFKDTGLTNGSCGQYHYFSRKQTPIIIFYDGDCKLITNDVDASQTMEIYNMIEK